MNSITQGPPQMFLDPRKESPTDLRTSRLREVARELEATFLSEMLKSAGVGAPRETLGGGVGEDQFGSFLRDAQANEMVKAGGIGLTEHLFQALKARDDGVV